MNAIRERWQTMIGFLAWLTGRRKPNRRRPRPR